MSLEQIKSRLATEFAAGDRSPRHLPLQISANVTTISYGAGGKTWKSNEARGGVGIVAGMIDSRGRKVITCGDLPLNEDAVFEIGSATKVFTALLLCDMVQRGEMKLTDAISDYLPAEVRVPQRNERQITFEDLATHTSSLPRLPSNMKPKEQANPYADYSVAQLYEFLSAYELPRDIGSQFEYSNLGLGLLGHILSLRSGKSYDALLHDRIAGPLDMKDTAVSLTPAMKARLAAGFDGQMLPAGNWDMPTFAGAGELKSTVNDLLTFLGANMGLVKTPLDSAMASMLEVRRPTGAPGIDIALAWHLFANKDSVIVGHGGMTGGYSSFIGYDRKAKVGIALLSNGQMWGLSEIGLHLLRTT